jgi:ribosomal protein S18 acetylase RimI-like enzyme
MPDWSLSICSLTEVEEVSGLVNAAYRGEGGQAGWTSEIGMVDGRRTTATALRDELASSNAAIVLLRQEQRLLACIRTEQSAASDGTILCNIGLLAVQPGEQDRGLGRALLRHAEDLGRARGAHLARMTVVSARAILIAWYERQGYERTGETEPFPYEDARFGNPRHPNLEFVVLTKRLREHS